MATLNISFNEIRGFVFNLDLYFEETVVGHERVFEADIGNGYKIRFFTSISEKSEEVREEGSDAMRVNVVNDDGDIIKSASHTKRTPGWDDRIEEKINKLIGCNECGDFLKVADGEHGKYFFCPECGNTQSIKT